MASQPQVPVTSQEIQGTDAGTNGAVRQLGQTQAVPYNPNGNQVGRRTGRITGFAETARGAVTGVIRDVRAQPQVQEPLISVGTAEYDDSGKTAPVQDKAPNLEFVTPRPNILDDYPSYTYQASVYMLTPEQYRLFQNDPRQNISGYNLLFQSGGVAAGSGVVLGSQAGRSAALSNTDQGRNPFFSQDFYIDDIALTTMVAGKGTGMAHSATELKFTVVEPSNISLVDRLYLAAQDLSPVQNGRINYMSMIYLMVIRFYALDQDGKIVKVGSKVDINTGSDRSVLVEKYIPFQVAGLSFTISSNLVRYDWTCTPVGQNMGLRIRKGTIPFDIELTGSTVDDLLNGDVIINQATVPSTTVTAPPAVTPAPRINRVTGFQSNPAGAAVATLRVGKNNRAAAQPTVDRSETQSTVATPSNTSVSPPKTATSVLTRGLIEAMNQDQQTKVRDGKRKYPDVYRIQYTPEAESLIKTALIQKPSDQINKAATPASTPVSENTQNASPDKQNMVTTARNYPITSGMQLVQAIELIVRNSEFITNQSNIIFDETSNQPKPNPKAKNQNQGMKWFNVMPSARIISDQYDDLINDFAHEITFTIGIYELRQFNSAFFPAPKFNGIHKQYFYWFTGQNTSVLDYRETFNTQYLLTVSGPSPKGTAKDKLNESVTSSMVDMAFVMQSPRSNESSQSALNRSNELAANAAENIYNPGDLAQTKLQIIGDPAWIMQGSMLGITDAKKIKSIPFNDDGSINFDTGEVLFEIAWQRPEDYDTSTGLADPYGRTSSISNQRRPLQSRIYRAINVLSEFRGGMFTQTLEGGLFTYPIKSGQTRAPNSSQPRADTQDAQQQQEPREQTINETVPVPGPNRILGFAENAGGAAVGIIRQGKRKSSTTADSGFLNSALAQNTVSTAASLRPSTVPTETNAQISAKTEQLPQTNNDTIQPSLPVKDIISNGEIVGIRESNTSVSGRVIGLGSRIATEGAIVLNGRSINPGDPSYASAARLLLDSYQQSSNTTAPQDISREP